MSIKMKESKQKPDLIIALDYGGSLTKMIGSTGSYFCGQMMEATVISVDSHSLISSQNSQLGITHPVNRAWIGIEQKYYAVGYLARSRYLASTRLNQLKSEQAIYKTLAGIWVFQQQWQLPRELKVAIVCVLPPGEWRDSKLFETELRKAAECFETPTGVVKAEISHFHCFPEGAGILMNHRRQKGSVAISHLNTAIVMLGYRNASVLLSKRGIVSDYQTSELGMIKMLKGIISRTSGYQEEQLVGAIALAGTVINEKPLQKLLRRSTASAQAEEMSNLRQSIEIARKDYVTALCHWLNEQISPEIDEIVFCGGTADYLYHFLSQEYQLQEVFWHAGVEIPSELISLKMGNRMADIWCLFSYLCEQLEIRLKRKKSKQNTVLVT
jgi:hypothetical protein